MSDKEAAGSPARSSDAGGSGADGEGAADKKPMSREERLFNLRLKMNSARNANKTAVADEAKRQLNPGAMKPGRVDWKKRKLETKEEKAKEKEQMHDLKEVDKAYLHKTALVCEEAQKKKKKKGKNAKAFGWDMFNLETMYMSHDRRVGRTHEKYGRQMKAEYEQLKKTAPDSVLDPDVNNDLDYGMNDQQMTEAGKSRITAELAEAEKRRAKFSRRRQHWEEKDVDYINERNRVFNEKLARFFDPYTVEIKQSLEHGTAR